MVYVLQFLNTQVSIESDKIPNPVVLKENTFCPIKDIDEHYRLAWIAKNDKQRHLILFLSTYLLFSFISTFSQWPILWNFF